MLAKKCPRCCGRTIRNPDSWKDFVETAKAAGAPFLTMSEVVLEKDDLELLLEELQEANFPDEESPAIEDAQSLATHVGRVGYIQLGFAHQGIVFLHENTTAWYERYQHLLESVRTSAISCWTTRMQTKSCEHA